MLNIDDNKDLEEQKKELDKIIEQSIDQETLKRIEIVDALTTSTRKELKIITSIEGSIECLPEMTYSDK